MSKKVAAATAATAAAAAPSLVLNVKGATKKAKKSDAQSAKKKSVKPASIMKATIKTGAALRHGKARYQGPLFSNTYLKTRLSTPSVKRILWCAGYGRVANDALIFLRQIWVQRLHEDVRGSVSYAMMSSKKTLKSVHVRRYYDHLGRALYGEPAVNTGRSKGVVKPTDASAPMENK